MITVRPVPCRSVGVISQTCSMNMFGKNISWYRGPIKRFTFPRHVHWTRLGKFLIPWRSPEGRTFPRQVHQKYRCFLHPFLFQMGGVRVVVCLGVRGLKISLFHDEKLAFFGLGVRVSNPIFTFLLGVRSKFWDFKGFGVATAAGPRVAVAPTYISFFTITFCKTPIENNSAGFHRKIRLFLACFQGYPLNFYDLPRESLWYFFAIFGGMIESLGVSPATAQQHRPRGVPPRASLKKNANIGIMIDNLVVSPAVM